VSRTKTFAWLQAYVGSSNDTGCAQQIHFSRETQIAGAAKEGRGSLPFPDPGKINPQEARRVEPCRFRSRLRYKAKHFHFFRQWFLGSGWPSHAEFF
jgi:hypothetical protein